MTRVLITGATGFIGRHVLHHLTRNGMTPIALSSSVRPERDDGVETVHADLSDEEQTRAAVRDAEASHLIHLAWQGVQAGLWSSPHNLHWVQRSMVLIDAFVEAGGHRMVVSGSCGEYDWSAGLCQEEVTQLRPSTIYGKCKNALHQLASAYCETRSVSLAWGRAFFVYGPGEHPSRLTSSVVESLASGEPALCSHGNQLRDYIHVDDLAEGYVTLLRSNCEGAYNLATGEAIRVRDLIYGLADALDARDLVRLGARQAAAHEPPLIFADMTKTNRDLDWRPKFSLEEGCRDVVSQFRG